MNLITKEATILCRKCSEYQPSKVEIDQAIKNTTDLLRSQRSIDAQTYFKVLSDQIELVHRKQQKRFGGAFDNDNQPDSIEDLKKLAANLPYKAIPIQSQSSLRFGGADSDEEADVEDVTMEHEKQNKRYSNYEDEDDEEYNQNNIKKRYKRSGGDTDNDKIETPVAQNNNNTNGTKKAASWFSGLKLKSNNAYGTVTNSKVAVGLKNDVSSVVNTAKDRVLNAKATALKSLEDQFKQKLTDLPTIKAYAKMWGIKWNDQDIQNVRNSLIDKSDSALVVELRKQLFAAASDKIANHKGEIISKVALLL